jgi:phosphatidylserine/phosphatidylglycerophosphate/cardiolipin synthase-like enzyme
VRIYLDAGRLREIEGSKAFQALAETPSVEIRVKQESSALMHLKSYQVDGHVLRTGAANFSASGLKREDDDLIVIESAEGPLKTVLTSPKLLEISLLLRQIPGQCHKAKEIARFVADDGEPEIHKIRCMHARPSRNRGVEQ